MCQQDQGEVTNIILAPRTAALTYTYTAKNIVGGTSLCAALDAIEKTTRSSQERGGSKHGIGNKKRKYSSIGTQTSRATTGIRLIHYTLSKSTPIHQESLLKYFRGVEHLFVMYVDTPHIRLIREAIDLVQTKTFTVPSRQSHGKLMPSASSRIYDAIAYGVNEYLDAHTNKDFTYCANSIHMRTIYRLSKEIVAYFAFPKLGVAIPLHLGDVLFFNPKEDPCISSRCKDGQYTLHVLVF